MSLRRHVWLSCASVSSALAIAACGGSSHKPHAASGGPALKFAQCMRAHGLSNFPDPSAGGGGIQFQASGGLNPQSPGFKSAQQACRKYAPGLPGLAKPTASARRRALKFSECVRAHGEPDFPDPTLSPPSNIGSGTVIGLHGLYFDLSTIDPTSPSFRQAAAACGLHIR